MKRLPVGALALLAATGLVDAGCGGPAAPKGDARRGEIVHEACLSCHGTALYNAPDRKIQSVAALRKEVECWGDYYNPALSEQEVDDLVAYLNTNFYQFEE